MSTQRPAATATAAATAAPAAPAAGAGLPGAKAGGSWASLVSSNKPSAPTAAAPALAVHGPAKTAVASADAAPASSAAAAVNGAAGHSGSNLFDLASGAVVKIVTVNDRVVEGTVFASDQKSHAVALYSGDDRKNVFVLPHDAIKSFTVVRQSAAKGARYELVTDEESAKKREFEARNKRLIESYKINRGVPDYAQAIFDAFDKALPTRWEGNNIVVMDVKISPDYTAADCKGGKEDALTRVKTILEETRRKLKL